MKTIRIIQLFIVFMLTSCSLFQGESDTVVEMLPRESDVPGWSKAGSDLYLKKKEIVKYNKDYRGMGIERLASSVYESIDDSGTKIRLEVMRFNSVLDAYGFFSIKRGPGIFEISGTNEFYSNEIGIIQSGEYVVYSFTDRSGSLLKKELKTFVNIPLLYIGKKVDQNTVPKSTDMIKGVDGYGVLYSKKPYHKFPQIREIYFTQWSWDGDIVEVFFSDRGSFYDAYELFKKVSVTDYILISSDDRYTAFKKEQDGRYCFISVRERWIFGCWSIKGFDEGKNILNEIVFRLEEYQKKNR